VTITGVGFAGASAVRFGSKDATGFNVSSETSITATAPPGAGSVDVTVEDIGGTSPTSSADEFTYGPALAVASASLPDGDVGTGYSQTLAASGGSAPYTWSLDGGSLPAGLSLNPETGAITGVPSALGTSSFPIRVTDSSTPTPQIATANLSITVTEHTFATSFGPGDIEGSFNDPDAVAVDPSGDIFVGDSAHNRVLEFNSKHEYLRQFGSQGSAEGQFQGIQGIATNTSGDVYVSGSDRIQEFSPTGAYLRQFGSPGSEDGQFLSPAAVAIDSSGNVWVLDSFNYRLQEFSPSGEYLGEFGTEGKGNGQLGWAFGLAISGGNLYVSEFGNNRVQEFSTSGTYLGQFGSSGSGNGEFHGPWGIASDPNTGNLYVADMANNRVQEFSPAGSFIAAFGSAGSGAGQLSAPRAVAVGLSGNVLIADTVNNRIEEWLTSP
jgi:sugar lactone lactonase YvrE